MGRLLVPKNKKKTSQNSSWQEGTVFIKTFDEKEELQVREKLVVPVTCLGTR